MISRLRLLQTPSNMKTIQKNILGLLVIFFVSAKLSGQTTSPSHAESPTVQPDEGASHFMSASTSRPISHPSGEAATSGPAPQEEETFPPSATTLPSLTETIHTSASNPVQSTAITGGGEGEGGGGDVTAGKTLGFFSTLGRIPDQSDSTLSTKPFSYTVSPEKATTTTGPVTTTTTSSANQTDSDDLTTHTSTSSLLTTPAMPQSTLIPLFTQTTHQSTQQASTAKTDIETTSLPAPPAPTPTPTQLLRSESPQPPDHLTMAPPQQEEPSQLDVGDEDAKHEGHHPPSPLDPLLAGLVSVFIICTAIASVLLFLKFRHRNEHPEFHRLQDLPMEDLLEDAPLSRYTY
ncbi:uncharacterized protein si:ch73-344o19.1 [Engraulis encrasicolus]|uniref:uncharacterized protein si:ch73-344o19.1 n=1 Tax=Engraulis encrasicolus TaxID=184585 RepID=UPI002FD74582